MFIRSFLFRHAPTPGSLFDRAGSNSLSVITRPMIRLYLHWWESSRVALTVWHRTQLTHIDKRFAYQEAVREVIKAREVAREKGIGPLSPLYPDVKNILPKNFFR